MSFDNQRPRTFSKSLRLLKSGQFDEVFRAQCSEADSRLIVYGRPRTWDDPDRLPPRLGLVVSKKCGNSVCRNRWKRLIREAFRCQQHVLPAGMDLVVLPRPGTSPRSGEIARSLLQLALRVASKARRDQRQPSSADARSADRASGGPAPTSC